MTHLGKYLRMNVQGELVITDSADGPEVTLADYHRAKEDERLGRWRWSEYPNYVVYPSTNDSRPESRAGRGVTVLSELPPRCYTVWEERVGGFNHQRADRVTQDMAHRAAAAYFHAHPGPKPWWSAECGQGWALEIEGERDDILWVVQRRDNIPVFRRAGEYAGVAEYDLAAPEIKSGRIIWPEVAS